MKKVKIKYSFSDILFHIVNMTLMGLFAFVCVYPFYYVIINSISGSSYVNAGQIVLYPREIHFETYRQMLEMPGVFRAMCVSVARTVFGTLTTLLSTTVVGYTISKKEFWHRKFWYRFLIVTMYLSSGIVPAYLTMKMLGLLDSFFVYIIPSMVAPYSMILVKTYIEGLPESLEEAAHIDGAGYFVRFSKIVLPLSKPIIATIAIFAAVGQWNSYMDTVLYMNTNKYQTMQSVLYQFLNKSNAIADMIKSGNFSNVEMVAENVITAKTVRFTMTAVTVLPVLFVYPFFQKYFTKGIMVGAIKG